MSLMDNRLVHVALLAVAVYVIVQIMNKNSAQEHLDTPIVSTAGTSSPTVDIVPASTSTSSGKPAAVSVSAIPTGSPAPALQTVSLDGTNPSGAPVVNLSGTALTNTAQTPSPMASTDETLLAAAPASLPGESIADFSKTVQAVDPDFLFGRRTALDPAELIPKTPSAELYAGIAADPRLSGGEFLQNRWSLGIDASITRHNVVNDLRGSPPAPALAIVSPWGNPSKTMDVMRRTIAEVS